MAFLSQILLTISMTALLVLSSAFPNYSYAATQPLNLELEEQVLRIIEDHPESIIKSVQSYQVSQQKLAMKAQEEKIANLDLASLVKDSPVLGAKNSKVILMEFSDFECPFCARAHDTLKEFMAKHKDEVTLVFKHLPLFQIHEQALPAAKAAWAANQQGKFWEFHDALFRDQPKLDLGDKFYVKIATDLKLDLEQFNKDRDSAKAGLSIEEDLKLANTLQVQGTPFMVLGKKIVPGGATVQQLEELLKAS